MMKDTFDRAITYMRISVTDRCNLRCVYCMPPGGLKPLAHKDILRYEEIERIVRIAVHKGVRKVRLTGGEPLVRKDIPLLVSLIRRIEGIAELSMTTNGILLSQYAAQLADAGLERVNVSLDSLNARRYCEITRGGDVDKVLGGLEAAESAGLVPLKINVVPIRGLNDEEIGEFAKLTLQSRYQVRFIEFMPFVSEDLWNREHFVSADEIKARVERIGPLIPVKVPKSGPAQYFRFKGAAGVIGFISPISNHFCEDCNRLRLTADGKLRPCLFSETEIDLKPALRSNGSDAEIKRLIEISIAAKPKGHSVNMEQLSSGSDCFPMRSFRRSRRRPMSGIGG